MMKFPKTIVALLLSMLVCHALFSQSEIDKLKNDEQVTAFLQKHFKAFSDHHYLRNNVDDVWKKEARYLKRNYGDGNFWKGDFDDDGRTDLLIVVDSEGVEREKRELITVIFDTGNGYAKIPILKERPRRWISRNFFPSVVLHRGLDVVKVNYIIDHSLIYQSWDDINFDKLAARKIKEVFFFYHNELFYQGKGLEKVQIDSVVIKKGRGNSHSMPAPLTSILIDFTKNKFTAQRFYSLNALRYTPYVLHRLEKEIMQVGSLNQNALFEIKRHLATGSFLSYKGSYGLGCSGPPGLRLTIHYNNDQEFSVTSLGRGPTALKIIMEIILNEIKWEITDDPFSSQFKRHYSPQHIENYRKVKE